MFHGSFVALVTPMSADGGVDEESLGSLIDWHVEQGTDGIVAVGTTGESATLDEQEHCAAIRRIVELTAGRLPVMAGTGANSTTEAIQLTRCAKEVGADAALLVTPYYNKPTQEGLYLHHKAIAEAVDLPQMLYNVPGRTVCDLLPGTIGRLSKISNIIGVKEATGDLARVPQIRALCGDEFDIFSGDDASSRELILAGGQGTISVTANIAPAAVSQMIAAALAGDSARALEIDRQIEMLHRDLFLESNPIPVKWALHEMGRIPNGIRLPLTWLAQEYHDSLRRSMKQAGVL